MIEYKFRFGDDNGDVEERKVRCSWWMGLTGRSLMMAGGHACWLTEDDARGGDGRREDPFLAPILLGKVAVGVQAASAPCMAARPFAASSSTSEPFFTTAIDVCCRSRGKIGDESFPNKNVCVC
jgi:hypothetical protein